MTPSRHVSYHDRLLDRAVAFLPLPDPLPTIRRGPGPAYADLDYYAPLSNEIWLLPTSWRSGRTLGHELGHAFATLYLTSREWRTAAARLTGRPGLRWFWGSWNPLTHWKQPNEENFADAYARLFVDGVRTRRDRRLERFLRQARAAAP